MSIVNQVAFTAYIMCAVAAVVAVVWRKPHVCLIFLLPLFPLRNVVEQFYQFPMGKDLIDILLIATLISIMAQAYIQGTEMFSPTPMNTLLVILMAYTYLSLWRSSLYLDYPAPFNPADPRVQAWKNYMMFPLLFFCAANGIKSIAQMKWVIITMVITMIIMDYYTINQLRWMSGIASRDKITGTFVVIGANELASFYTAYTFALVGIMLADPALFQRLSLLGIILINFGCMIFLYSRGAYIAMAAGIAVLGFLRNKLFLVLIVLGFIFWQMVLPVDVVERINQTHTEQGTLDEASLHRLELWRIGMLLFERHPVIGAGFNVISIMGLSVSNGMVYRDTHNIYIKTLAEQGLIGLLLLLLIFYYGLRAGWSLYRTADNGFLQGLGLGFVLCVVVTLVSNFFGDRWTHLQVGAFFWIFLGLVARGNLLVEAAKQKEDAV